MHDKTREGTYFSAYVCVCDRVAHMSTIVSHSLEIAAEIKENNKDGGENLKLELNI